jgi:hypothetical protein
LVRIAVIGSLLVIAFFLFLLVLLNFFGPVAEEAGLLVLSLLPACFRFLSAREGVDSL